MDVRPVLACIPVDCASCAVESEECTTVGPSRNTVHDLGHRARAVYRDVVEAVVEAGKS
jgi:hypothetical protein